MGKKIIISESQYKRVFLNEQSSIDDIIVYFDEDKGTIIEQTARLYRLWANSTPELSKKYGKESEFDLDASRKPANSGTFEKSFSKGKSQFDKDWLIVPKEKNFLLFTKGGRTKYSVLTKKVLPNELSEQDYFYIGDRDSFIRDGETYPSGKGSKIKEELKNIYSSSNTKKAINVTQKEKESDIEKKLVSFRNTIDGLEKIGLGVSAPFIGRLIPYKKTDTFKNAEDIPSQNYLFARTAINAMKYLTDLMADKVITGSKGATSICVTKLDSGCKSSNPYVTSSTYDINLSRILSSSPIKTIYGEYPASWIMYDYGFYFNWEKIKKDLENKFKSDKFAYKSSLFPDGWWNYFTQTYGVGSEGSFPQIKSAIKKISYDDFDKVSTINKYEDSTSVWEYLGDCFSDYHCVLDVASIASLAIPGVGLAISAGLDIINAGSYGVEAYNADSEEEKDAALIAGTLTLFGGLLGGGVSQTKRLVTKGNANPKIYKYTDEVMDRVNKEIPNAKNLKELDPRKGNIIQRNLNKKQIPEKLTKIYKETAEKYGLKDSEILIAHDILKDFSKIDPNIAQKYTEALNAITKKVDRASLTKFAQKPDFQKMLMSNNGDVVVTLSKYMKMVAKKEAVMEASLFAALTVAMEEPEVQKWIGDRYMDLKYMGRTDIRSMVEKEGYDWESTKELFGSDSSGEDNTLLKQAWEKGWRPWPKGKEEPTEEDFAIGFKWLLDNSKYQTEKFKGGIGQYGNTKKQKYLVTPENEKDKEEGVIYIKDKEIVDIINNTDNNITDEELKLSQNASL
jgi:hypothetical protein